MGEFENPYREDRQPSKGEEEVAQGYLLLMLFRWLKIPMPREDDERSVRRVGELVIRKWPWLLRFEDAVAKKYGLKK